jgi:hypothetical protein
MSLPAHIRWSRGGEASLSALDGDRIAVLSTTASAPGSRPEGTLPSGTALRIKVARCRREGEGFLIEGRLLDATRDTRGELQRLVEGSAGALGLGPPAAPSLEGSRERRGGPS